MVKWEPARPRTRWDYVSAAAIFVGAIIVLVLVVRMFAGSP